MNCYGLKNYLFLMNSGVGSIADDLGREGVMEARKCFLNEGWSVIYMDGTGIKL